MPLPNNLDSVLKTMGEIRALFYELYRIIDRLKISAYEDGTALTSADITRFKNWYDGWKVKFVNKSKELP